jgi:hypothetical protein
MWRNRMYKGKSENLSIPMVFDAKTKERLEAHGYGIDELEWKDGLAGPVLRDPVSTKRLDELVRLTQSRFDRKLPIFREAAFFREEAAKVWADLPQVDWFSELLGNQKFKHMQTLVGNGVADLQSTMMVWVCQKLREVSDTSNWFRPTEGLTYKLLATDLKGAVVGDLKLPYPAFYVEVPSKVFYLQDKKTGWHEVRALTVVRGCITERTVEIARGIGDILAGTIELGDRLIIEAYAEPNANSANPFDDAWLFKSYRIEDESASIDIIVDRSIYHDREYERTLNRGRIGERELDGLEVRTMLMQFVLNLCIYLGTDKATVEHIHKEEIERLHKGKKFKNLRKNVQDRVRDLQNDKVFLVGTDVAVDHEIKEYVRTEGTGGFKLTYRTLVRGHWRNQAHGPKRALRTRKWIEPHIRGAELPTKVVGHTYEVE